MIKVKPTTKAYWNESLKSIYIPIPKCASSSIKPFFVEKNYIREYIDISSVNVQEVIIILRNPIERFISAIHEICKLRHDAPNTPVIKDSEMYKEYKKGNYKTAIDIAIDMVCEHGFFDEHLIPQITYLNNTGIDMYNQGDIIVRISILKNGIFNPLLEYVGIHIERCVNKSKVPSHSIEISNDIRQKILQLYIDDVNLINYCEKNNLC